MNANLPATDIFWTVLSAVVFVAILLCAASWMIDNALLPALRGLLHPVGPWLERRSPPKGRHARQGQHPPDYDANHFGAPDEPFWKDGIDSPGPAAPPGTHPSAGPGDLDALDLMIEAARQHTSADPQLLPAIRAALGFDSVDCWEDHAWAMVRATAVACG